MLSDGQGEMKGQILRIAHIGYLDYLDCIGIIAGLEQVLASAQTGELPIWRRTARRPTGLRRGTQERRAKQ